MDLALRNFRHIAAIAEEITKETEGLPEGDRVSILAEIAIYLETELNDAGYYRDSVGDFVDVVSRHNTTKARES